VAFYKQKDVASLCQNMAFLSSKKASRTSHHIGLEKRRESMDLTEIEKSNMNKIASKLSKIWALVDIKSRHRSRKRNILAREKNKAYFKL
jgi:hypothetical protein